MTAANEEALPIREISRLTGVNSVTLRAWERRYGLIKPMRTHKGHRLYRAEDVALIKDIQSWLARGLSIGKICELLSDVEPAEAPVEDIWKAYFNELQVIVADMHSNKLESFFSPLFSVYPAAIIADRLIYPTLNSLNQTVYGNHLKKIMFVNYLSEYLMMLTQRQRHQAKGKAIGIIQLTTANEPLLNLVLHYGLITGLHKSELIGLISPEEILFAVERLQLGALLIYNNSVASLAQWEKNLFWLAHKVSIPVVIGGSLAQVMKSDYPTHIHLAAGYNQQSVIEALEKLIFPLLTTEEK